MFSCLLALDLMIHELIFVSRVSLQNAMSSYCNGIF